VGAPFFTTDSGAALRAAEMGCDALLKGTSVDGVYTADPKKDPSAQKLDVLSYDDALRRDIRVMDQTAMTMCKDNDLSMVVFGMEGEGNVTRAILGERLGTLVTP
jgi:uridylate kinase